MLEKLIAGIFAAGMLFTSTPINAKPQEYLGEYKLTLKEQDKKPLCSEIPPYLVGKVDCEYESQPTLDPSPSPAPEENAEKKTCPPYLVGKVEGCGPVYVPSSSPNFNTNSSYSAPSYAAPTEKRNKIGGYLIGGGAAIALMGHALSTTACEGDGPCENQGTPAIIGDVVGLGLIIWGIVDLCID